MTTGADWSEHVLALWFGALTPQDWFRKNDALDARLRDEFSSTYKEVREAFDLEAALSSDDVALATLITLDQFPRNMFRGTPRAFESDRMALELAHAALKQGLDQQVPAERRLFFYLPFEHSEQLADQDISVAQFEKLGNASYVKYAEAHRDIIRRFGRFPHRNAILGRTSTPEEIAYLAEPGSGF